MDTSIKTVLKGLDQRMIDFMNKHNIGGMSLGVVQDGKIIYAKGMGLADARTQKPVTPDTIFRIASISKTFTAIGLMQLWEQGKFQLDDPVNYYLKSYKVQHRNPSAPPVTFRHMLTHRSGIGEMPTTAQLLMGLLPFRDRHAYKPGDRVPSLAEYYHGLLQPDVFPEKKWAYANNAYATLGQVIADISGMPFSQYMLEHVFEPLGMMHSDFELSERVREGLATGYMFEKGRLVPQEYHLFPGQAAGTVHSSTNEMALYLEALMNGGANSSGSIIKPETLKMMMTPQYQEHPRLAAMGLGFMIEDFDGHKACWHGGSLPGFNSSLWVAPDDKLGLIVWANTSTRAIYVFGGGVLRSLLGLPDYDKRLPIAGVRAPTHLYNQMLGTYRPYRGLNSNSRALMTFGNEIEISIKNNQLSFRSLDGAYKKSAPLFPADANDPLVFENVTDGKLLSLAFQRNPDGFIDRFSLTSLMYFTFYKVPRIKSLRFQIKAGLIGLATLILGAIGIRILKKKRKCC